MPHTVAPIARPPRLSTAKIRPFISTFDNTNYLTTLPNGEVCAVNSWSGDYGVAKKRAADAGIKLDLQYFVPKTGAPAWKFNTIAHSGEPGGDSWGRITDDFRKGGETWIAGSYDPELNLTYWGIAQAKPPRAPASTCTVPPSPVPKLEASPSPRPPAARKSLPS